MEHRRNVRYPVDLPANLETVQIYSEGRVFNLNSRGCKIIADTTVKPGEYLSLWMLFPSEGEPLSVSKATVRWVKGWEFGCEFIKVNQQERARLTEFITTLEK